MRHPVRLGRLSLPGDHQGGAEGEVRSHPDGVARPARHFEPAAGQRDVQGPAAHQGACAGGALMNHPAAPSLSLTDKLIARKEGAIGWIIFNNPERHNATSFEMWQ